MEKKKRVFAAVLVCSLLLSGCGAVRTEPEPYPESADSESAKTVAYVPLDDRPDNVERVVYLAESLGYVLAMPEADWYRTGPPPEPTTTRRTTPSPSVEASVFSGSRNGR